MGGSLVGNEERDIPGFRLRRCSDSKAVMCETVVKTSAQWVADRSIQYLSVSHLKSLEDRMNDVPVVDTPLSSLMINIKVLQVVIEINTSSTQVSTKQSSVGGKDGSYVNVPLSAEGNSETGLPFVEVGYDCRFGFSGCELGSACCMIKYRSWKSKGHTSPRNHATMYPNTIASLVSWSFGGEGIPARFHRSAFHSSILDVSVIRP